MTEYKWNGAIRRVKRVWRVINPYPTSLRLGCFNRTIERGIMCRKGIVNSIIKNKMDWRDSNEFGEKLFKKVVRLKVMAYAMAKNW